MSGAMRIWHSSPDQMEPYGDCSALTLVHLRSGCETTQQNNALLHNGEGLLDWTRLPSIWHFFGFPFPLVYLCRAHA